MADTVSVVCPECDKKSSVPEEILGRKVKCKGCGESFVARASASAKKAQKVEKKPEKKPEKEPEKKPEKKKPTDVDDDNDGKAYGMTEEYLGARCPECASKMEDDQVLCLECGYNVQTRGRAEKKIVVDHSGMDIFVWILPGLGALLGVLVLIGFNVWYCLKMDEIVEKEWYFFIAHPSIKLWLVIMSCWPTFYGIKFAIKRLIYDNQPPEIVVHEKLK